MANWLVVQFSPVWSNRETRPLYRRIYFYQVYGRTECHLFKAVLRAAPPHGI